MKNIFIIDEYASSKSNGIGTYIRELTYCLRKMNVNITLVSFNYDIERFTIVSEDNLTKLLFPKMRGFCFSHYKIITYFLKLYIEDSPDNLFLVNHSPCGDFLKSLKRSFPLSKSAFVIHDMGWTFSLLGDTARLEEEVSSKHSKRVIDVYDDVVKFYEEEQQMYKAVDKVIVLAKETERLLKKVYLVDDRKMYFAPNGLRDSYMKLNKNEIKRLKSEFHISENEKIILYAGRVNKIKGIYQLINCFKKVLEHVPNSRLVIIGTLFEPIDTLKHSSEVAAKITYTGQIASERVKKWYQIADIGILPSFVEQCSYTGIEMLMYGLPIVASDGFCMGDMFIDDKNAKVARIGDRNDSVEFENNLLEALLKLLKSDDLCKKIGQNSRKIYKSRYQIRHMEKVYQTLLDSL